MRRALLLLLLQLFLLPAAFGREKIFVIVNGANPMTSMSVTLLRDMFLKRVRTWPDGTPVRFFDRTDNSQERGIFLRVYLQRSARQIDQHWIGQKLYSGDSAPTQVAAESVAASLVSRFPGGISYVSSTFTGAKGVKAIEVQGE